ncbi:MAG: hypothetical protein H7249_00795 [Chitinophagaceae bacterium]|nr:hypothetical protein [Oligoflexus sp.]
MRTFHLALKSLTSGLLFIGVLTACGKSSTTNAGGSVVDFTKNDVIMFYSASGSFVSGNRYDLELPASTLRKYTISAKSNAYELVKETTLTAAQKGDLSEQLKVVSVKTLSACSAAVCDGARPSVWMGLPRKNPVLYYFANKGDCTCPDDKANAPVLSYDQMNTINTEILGLLP